MSRTSLNARLADIAGLFGMLFVASPVVGAVTFAASVLLGGQSFESDAPRASAQYLSLLILVAWCGLSYLAARYAGLERAGAGIAAALAVAWSIGSLVLLAAVA